MEWRDEAIVLGTRRHGETSAILEVMTRTRGRHLGLVRGGRSRKQQPTLQAGNVVDVVWRARLDEHLGMFQAEPIASHAARMFESACGVFAIQTIAAHLRLLPERDPHAALYESLKVMLAHLPQPPAAAELLVRFELLVLEELGFGLDLQTCASTGQQHDLAYVSPKSGRAVSRDAGAPWRDKMLALPPFLALGSGLRADHPSLRDAFRLTGFFLNRSVYEPRGMIEPEARGGFLNALDRHFARAELAKGESVA